jgi:hypothetical protein
MISKCLQDLKAAKLLDEITGEVDPEPPYPSP